MTIKNRFSHSLIISAIATLVGGATVNAATPKVEFVPGEYVVKLKQSVKGLNNKSLATMFNSESAKSISNSSNLLLVKKNLLETKEFSIESIKSSDMVEYVEPNYIYHALKTNKEDDVAKLVPNDPLLGQLWGMINDGQDTSINEAGKVGIDIDADRAWAISTGSRNVIVAVIDTGVDYGIADLAPNMWVNEAEANGQPGVDDDGNGYIDDIHGYDFVNHDGDPMDDHGHGSHCSGTIGAKGNDGQGVVGVNWNVRIMALKFLSAGGSGTLADAVSAIDYATANGAMVMSNSWGGGPRSEALLEAIQRSNEKGALFVAAAGNHQADNDASPSYPASYEVPNVVSVAAIDNKGSLASFSCYGKTTVHVAAPGVAILSTTPDGFKSWAGTSMATPHVSGVAALLLANEPGLTNVQLKERIISSARPLAGLRNKVAANGLLNAYHALTNTPAPIDANDPFYWEKAVESVETAHPYADNNTQSFTVTKAGASQVAVHFARFETEGGYDKVTFKDAQGNIVDVWSGNYNDSFSPAVNGDTMVIEFTSDGSVNQFGFLIDQVAYRHSADQLAQK